MIRKVNSIKWILTASVYGILQGLVWTASSLLCILCFTKLLPNNINTINYVSTLGVLNNIYYLFLKDDSKRLASSDLKVWMRPAVFFGFMFVYLVLSFVWFCISIWIVVLNYRNKTQPIILGIWSCIVLTFSLIDLIIFSILLRDYSYLTNELPELSQDPQNHIALWGYTTVIHSVMRGYIIWIINIALAAYLMRITLGIYKNNEDDGTTSVRDIIYGYGSQSTNPMSQISAPHLQTAQNHNYYQNISHPNEPETNTNERKTNGILRKTNSNISFIHQLNSDPNYQNSATVNNLYEPNSPWIPRPDYSPPNSPRLASRGLR